MPAIGTAIKALAWVPTQFESSKDYVVDLGNEGAAEVLHAVKQFNGKKKSGFRSTATVLHSLEHPSCGLWR